MHEEVEKLKERMMQNPENEAHKSDVADQDKPGGRGKPRAKASKPKKK